MADGFRGIIPNKTRQLGSSTAARRHIKCLIFWLAMPALMSCTDDRQSIQLEKSEIAVQPIYRDIDDWLLACSNLRVCSVRSVNEDPALAGELAMTREPGPKGQVRLLITRIGLEEGLDLRDLEVDDRPIAIPLNWQAPADSNSASLDHGQAVRFIKAVTSGHKLSFGRGDLRSSISLDGFARSIVGMDEAQGRAGTVTALIQTGVKPASAVPAAIALPVLYAAPAQMPSDLGNQFVAHVRKAQSELLRKKDCEADPAQQGDVAYALDDERNLVMLSCYMGAYQASYLVFVAPKTTPERAQILSLPKGPIRSGDSPETGGEFTEAQWDSRSSTLSTDERGRGTGDCGESLSWTYLGKGKWRISEQRALYRCGGGFRELPQLYKANVIVSETFFDRALGFKPDALSDNFGAHDHLLDVWSRDWMVRI